ncbi:hypothetical protein MKW98_015868, partial [Papaver atlanticum]
ASSGIGVETARILDVKEAIVKENHGAKLDVMELDLSSMVSVRKFATEFNSLDLPINIL